jgi:hypothetical protein
MGKNFSTTLTDPRELSYTQYMPSVAKTSSYYPLSHYDFFQATRKVLSDVGLIATSTAFGISPTGDRMFMWVETSGRVGSNPIYVGGRNSYDKSMSAGLCVGTQIMVCSNKVLASWENGGVISKKHTSEENVDLLAQKFRELIERQGQISNDKSFYNQLTELQYSGGRVLSSDRAKAITVDLASQNIIRPTDIVPICKEFVEPSHEEFGQYCNTSYGLLMAGTEVFKRHESPNYQVRAYDGLAKVLGL